MAQQKLGLFDLLYRSKLVPLIGVISDHFDARDENGQHERE